MREEVGFLEGNYHLEENKIKKEIKGSKSLLGYFKR
jgi:hypothetical protein